MALFLVALTLLGSGVGAYVCLTPDPIRVGAYVLVGPSFVPQLTGLGSVRLRLTSNSLPQTFPQDGRPVFFFPRGLNSSQVDVAEVLWQWGSLRWLRFLITQ